MRNRSKLKIARIIQGVSLLVLLGLLTAIIRIQLIYQKGKEEYDDLLENHTTVLDTVAHQEGEIKQKSRERELDGNAADIAQDGGLSVEDESNMGDALEGSKHRDSNQDMDRKQDLADMIPKLEIDFEGLMKINPDIVGWIYACEGDINYPVVQNEDNAYYLQHMFDGKVNTSGCLFVDYNCEKPFDNFTRIYGHHMKNGTMFTPLLRYEKKEYLQEFPYIFIFTPEETYVFQIKDTYKIQAGEKLKREERKELVLSTCEYSRADGRWIVEADRVE